MKALQSLCVVVASAFSVVALAERSTAVNSPADRKPAPVEYRSAFDGYRAYQEPTLRPWREVNAEAGLLGGHAGQLKTQATPAPRDPIPPTPADTGHSGHKGHPK